VCLPARRLYEQRREFKDTFVGADDGEDVLCTGLEVAPYINRPISVAKGVTKGAAAAGATTTT